MNTNEIKFEVIQQIGLITLHRPHALNALTNEMVVAMYHQLGEWAEDPTIKAVVINGDGEKAFCAGGDIRKVYEARNNPQHIDPKKFFWDEYRLNHRIYHFPKPYISLLDGITMGGGVGISIHGSHRVATERFSFAMPETGIGFFPDVGASFFLPRCPDQTGIYLGLSGARIKAADALELKFVTHYVPAKHLSALIETLSKADYSADWPRDVVSEIIKHFTRDAGTPELKLYHPHINLCFSHQTVENILKELDGHRLEWCHQVSAILKTKSPTSLKVTLHALRHGAMINFDQCMQTEYRLAVRFLEGHDFFEGVRAVIIDKDQKPQWQPSELSAISESDVEKFFAPLQETTELNFV